MSSSLNTVDIIPILGSDGKYYLGLTKSELREIIYAIEKTNKSRECARLNYAKKNGRVPKESKLIVTRLNIIMPDNAHQPPTNLPLLQQNPIIYPTIAINPTIAVNPTPSNQ